MTAHTQMPIQEYHGRKYRNLKNRPRQIPMALLNEVQAQTNHSQSLDRLAERGGLAACEVLAIIERRPWHKMDKQAAIDYLNSYIEAATDTPYDTYRKWCEDAGIMPVPKTKFKRIDGLIVIVALYWKDKTVQLDGYCFRGCRFNSCKLIFKTTRYKLERCHVDSDCTIEAAT